MASSINASTSGGGGVIVTSDATGNLDIQSGGSTVVAVSSTGVAVTGTLAVSGAVTLTGSLNAPNTFGFKNRIINGGMVIDQRNAGASVAITTSDTYVTDRFCPQIFGGATGRFTAQQVSTAPTGFNNSLQLTVTTTSASPSSGDGYCIQQRIEGYNVADLGFGTASAQTITVSFWVRSSVTGSFGLLLNNAAPSRTYGVLYTINSANTWEQKSVTITGDTTGTWGTTNGTGIAVSFALGGGSNRTVNTGWSAYGTGAAPAYVTGGVNLMATNGATFYITGVQLEKGSTATSFDFRDYGRELAMCQRYYWSSNANTNTTDPALGAGVSASTTAAFIYVAYPVSMRAAPTLTTSGTFNYRSATSLAVSAVVLSTAGNDSCNLNATTAVNTAGYAGILRNGSTPTAAVLAFSSEL